MVPVDAAIRGKIVENPLGFQRRIGLNPIAMQFLRTPFGYVHETVVSQCVVLNGGSKFGLSARFKSLGTPLKVSANRVNVIWYESSDCTSGGQWGAYIEPKKFKAGWQNLNRKHPEFLRLSARRLPLL